MKTLEKVHVLDYGEFNKLVNRNFERFKNNYFFEVEREASNGSDYLFTDCFKKAKYEWEDDDLTRFLAGETRWINEHTILRALVTKDILPEGHYIIRVSW